MTEEITQEELEEIRKLRKQREQQKPVDFKTTIQNLISSLATAKTITRYDVKEKSYPSDLALYYDGGNHTTKNPLIVQRIARAECRFVEEHQDEIMRIVVDEMENELDEIRRLLE